jgi:hypothetical protein
MPPFAGQGMCSGLRDAANLSWKLDLVLGGKAPDTLLDSYGTERMPNVRAVIGFSIELGKVICIPDADEAAARDEFMIAALGQGGQSMGPPLPGVEEGIVEADSPEAGSVFIQGTVATGNGAPLPFDDAVGIGFRLITAGPIGGGVPADLLAWFASIGGRIVDFAPAGGLTDHRETYGRWLAKHEAFAVLQRPDFYVYGTASAPGDVPALIEGLRLRLGAVGG